MPKVIAMPEQNHENIKRRDFMKISGGAAVAFTGLGERIFAAEEPLMPNIVLILTDQQHLNTISAAGCSHIKTPALDRLKNRGTLFTHSYCSNPVCGPSRSCIFSGRTSSETGVSTNGRPIREGIPNLGQWLSRHSNYETIYSGKWHVPEGFTHFIPGFNVINTGIGGQGNVGDTSSSRACETYLHNRTSDHPFFMVASFLQPHHICEWLRINTYNPDRLRYPELEPELPPLPDNFEYDPREPEFVRRNRLRRDPTKGDWDKMQWRYYRWSYYRHVEMVDAEIGRILQALEDTDHLNDTVVIFTSDHGEGMGHHQNVRKNVLYEEALAVPFIISWPGQLPENQTDISHLITGLDIFPTVCDFAGIAAPNIMRGQSLRPLLTNASSNWHDAVFCESNNNQGRMVRTRRYKYIAYAHDEVDQLFDMQEDPGETRNLSADSQHISVLKEHRERLIEWEQQLVVAPDLKYADAYWRKG